MTGNTWPSEIHDDPQVPQGSLLNARVVVDQYVRPDGSLGVRTFYHGDIPLSQVLGLLALGAIDITSRVDRPDEGGT